MVLDMDLDMVYIVARGIPLKVFPYWYHREAAFPQPCSAMDGPVCIWRGHVAIWLVHLVVTRRRHSLAYSEVSRVPGVRLSHQDFVRGVLPASAAREVQRHGTAIARA